MKQSNRSQNDPAAEEPYRQRLSFFQNQSPFSAISLLVITSTVIAILLAESAVAVIISVFPSLPVPVQTSLHALLLTAMVLPLLYFFVLKPVRAHINRQSLLENMTFETEERLRKRIGQRLHDNLGQILTGVGFQLKVLEKKLEVPLPEESLYAAEISSHVNKAAQEIRQLAKELRSLEMDGDSLIAGLADLAAQTEQKHNIPCLFSHDKGIILESGSYAGHLYRIAEEAVASVLTHGNHPDMIEINLSREDDYVDLKVESSRSGNSGEDLQADEVGMEMMRSRASRIGAAFRIQSSKQKGRLISCRITNRTEEDIA